MKKMKHFKQTHPGLFLVCACYIVALLLAFLFHTGQFVLNRVLYASGALQATVLQMEDFTPTQLERLDDGRWVTTGSDPSLLLNDANLRVDTVRTQFVFTNEPLIETAFYAQPGEAHSLRQMVYAEESGDGQVYFLPARGVQSLRIDPDSSYGNIFEVGEIVLNEPRPFWVFYIPGGVEIGILLLVPAFVAGFLSVVQNTKYWAIVAKKVKKGCVPK